MEAPAEAAFSELVENGSFETGDFTGWTVIGGDDNGDWYVYTGILAPKSSNEILPPPDGAFAAVTDQDGEGTHILLQDLVLPPVRDISCSVIVYYSNPAVDFYIGSGLFAAGPNPNQQARIDILSPDADPFTVGSGILLKVYQTLPGFPPLQPYTKVQFNLSHFAGQTVTLRIAEVDNVFFFNFSVDNITCTAGGDETASIPTLGEWGMIVMAGVLGLAAVICAAQARD